MAGAWTSGSRCDYLYSVESLSEGGFLLKVHIRPKEGETPYDPAESKQFRRDVLFKGVSIITYDVIEGIHRYILGLQVPPTKELVLRIVERIMR